MQAAVFKSLIGDVYHLRRYTQENAIARTENARFKFQVGSLLSSNRKIQGLCECYLAIEMVHYGKILEYIKVERVSSTFRSINLTTEKYLSLHFLNHLSLHINKSAWNRKVTKVSPLPSLIFSHSLQAFFPISSKLEST